LPRLVRANTGRLIAELPALWFWPNARLFAHCQSATRSVLLDAIEKAKREKRGLLFMTPHLGSFEVIPRYIAQDVPMTVLFKPAKRASVDRLLREARNRGSVQSVPADLSGVRALLRCLKRGEAVGLLPDQVPGQGDGELAAFFGQQAWTMTLPQGLVRRANPIVLMAVAQRCLGAQPAGVGGWTLHFELYEGETTPRAINAAMEQWIRKLPEQYLWSYNRYKGTETVNI
jgi:KDO2-lipid IV(A) lauroyltransferase